MEEKYLYDNTKKYIFTNATNEVFVGMWGGVPETIPAGESRLVEEHLAYHYAKHLTDREMNKSGRPFADKVARDEYFVKFVSEVPKDMDVMSFLKKQMQDKVNEITDKVSDKVSEETVEKTVKKTEKKVAKKEVISDEDTFEGLN